MAPQASSGPKRYLICAKARDQSHNYRMLFSAVGLEVEMSEAEEGYGAWIAKPERARSRRFDFGLRRLTSDMDSPLWEVRLLEVTDELYAKDPVSDRYIVLGKFDTLWEVERDMTELTDDWSKGLMEVFGLPD